MLLAYALAVADCFPEEFVREIFSIDFLGKLDAQLESMSSNRFEMYEKITRVTHHWFCKFSHGTASKTRLFSRTNETSSQYITALPDILNMRTRLRLMELNRAVCLECPEFQVPWFHERYCRHLQKKGKPLRYTLNSQHREMYWFWGGISVHSGINSL